MLATALRFIDNDQLDTYHVVDFYLATEETFYRGLDQTLLIDLAHRSRQFDTMVRVLRFHRGRARRLNDDEILQWSDAIEGAMTRSRKLHHAMGIASLAVWVRYELRHFPHEHHLLFDELDQLEYAQV